jgi:hypothetical protein
MLFHKTHNLIQFMLFKTTIFLKRNRIKSEFSN